MVQFIKWLDTFAEVQKILARAYRAHRGQFRTVYAGAVLRIAANAVLMPVVKEILTDNPDMEPADALLAAIKTVEENWDHYAKKAAEVLAALGLRPEQINTAISDLRKFLAIVKNYLSARGAVSA